MALFNCLLVIFVTLFFLGRYEYTRSKNEKKVLLNELLNQKEALLREAFLKLENGGFEITRRIHVDLDNEIIFDDENKQVAVRSINTIKTVNYNDIIGYELYEDGGSIVDGSIDGSLVGALSIGSTGAIIGASGPKRTTSAVSSYASSLLLNIMINDIHNPIISIPFIEYETQKSSATYKSSIALAHEVIAILKYIETQVSNGTSTPE